MMKFKVIIIKINKFNKINLKKKQVKIIKQMIVNKKKRKRRRKKKKFVRQIDLVLRELRFKIHKDKLNNFKQMKPLIKKKIKMKKHNNKHKHLNYLKLHHNNKWMVNFRKNNK